eukprot:gnl/MRDRNA2_/MRDRNA2_250059_c0_seq1.p1 gnl/MRDRNA2_/MRDRNA2_250059_c0~~gnl/MRDRNA2_/MRDRNA2_250059_c0_seq1.p1  ORF type:complete len:149 (-),score=14.28 gnl/MRDRNA2_/MRDRNA2_250059_c0_seq1:3-383(-)
MEAHAMDEWPISSARYEPSGKPVSILKHRNVEHRLSAATNFRSTFDVQFPMAVDTLADEFEAVFCTWPFRFYVIQQKRVVYQAQPKDCTYSLEPLIAVLENYAAQHSTPEVDLLQQSTSWGLSRFR